MPNRQPPTSSAGAIRDHEAAPEPSFGEYVDELAGLVCARGPAARPDGVTGALDGEVTRRLRASVPLALRRREGAFFTSRALADQLIANDKTLVAESPVTADAACGAGDLLLAAARLLPVGNSVNDTLKAWGRRLVGCDLNRLYVRTTRLRLALLARARVGRGWRGDEAVLEELLPHITVGDGTALSLTEPRTLVLLNPPFGATVTRQSWGQGRVARAGVFTAEIVDRLPPSATLRAILPDVLRAGSNYRRWRAFIEERLDIHDVQPVGRFDPWTDVDVFLLRGVASDAGGVAAWWLPATGIECMPTVRDKFDVRVGPVVPHRDLVCGSESPYLRAHDLPQEGEHHPGAVRLQHPGPRFSPPLVVIRRTSRPEKRRARVVATLVRGDEPVLVENHLLVCAPRDRRLETCRQLIHALTDQRTTSWLNQRLRCRHLTVSTIREVPLPDWPEPVGE